ncbi:MAG: hypothetical protein KDN22_26575 [Verrucomicrobiae bacterium]|nr:hypothetical protein [Verrucomicrobiae bacterium]
MKTKTLIGTAATMALLAVASLNASAQGPGRGRMSPEAMEAIHGLFDSHDELKRTVKQTDDGYTSRTTSKNPAVVKLLQTHVKQMEKRLKQGMMVRRWDPAYEEFVRYYDDIDIQITNIENGISVTTVGKTEDAKKVARNHAGIVSKFVQEGWAEHDKTHAAVVVAEGSGDSAPEGAAVAKACCLASQKGGEGCKECAKGGKEEAEKAETKPCCKEEAVKDTKPCAECEKSAATESVESAER